MSQSSMDKGTLARSVPAQLRTFLGEHVAPLRPQLHQQSYRNLLVLAEGLVRMEGGPHALWTSRIATELYGGDHEPAEVKRLDRLLGHPGWSAYDIHTALHARGEAQAAELEGEVLIALDPSDFEKPESLHSEGLQKIVSPTARHLARPRRSFGGAPLPRPVTVPGVHVIAAVLLGMQGPAVLIDDRWWHKQRSEG